MVSWAPVQCIPSSWHVTCNYNVEVERETGLGGAGLASNIMVNTYGYSARHGS